MASVRIATSALVVSVLAAAGCGGGPEPDEVVRDYFAAIVERDGARACDQLTEELRADIESAPAALDSGRDCADVQQLGAALNPRLTEDDVAQLEIATEEDGDQAQATVENPFSRREETLDLVKDGDDWKISSLETRPGG